MPARQPFTHLCQQLAPLHSEAHRADLHMHTRFSDGEFSPEDAIGRAIRRGLGAVAITDHDTCAGVGPARAAARVAGGTLEVIAGVEITCEYQDRELHLLGYFFRDDDPGLSAVLAQLQQQRRERFWAMVERLPSVGIAISDTRVRERIAPAVALCRRDLAAILVEEGKVRTIQQAFGKYLRDGGPVCVPKRRLPVGDAIALIRAACGVSSWAHPPEEITDDQVQELGAWGLKALEAVYPSFRQSRIQRLRDLARRHGLLVTGGSDCHGPTPTRRAIGSYGISRTELTALRSACA